MEDPRNGRWTLTRGMLTVQPWPGLLHGAVHGRVLSQLIERVDLAQWRVLNVGCMTHRDPDTVRQIEVALYSYERVRGRRCPVTDYPTIGPELAFEVVDVADTPHSVLEKVDDLLAVGTDRVVVLNPLRRTAVLYHPDDEPTFLREQDRLALPAPLDGWTPTVAELLSEGN
ncbi:Uma2 family endonuclease [Alienimonas sp. DA493]|uniref:Uma2 family endonuclease n=1 Tax=Alienimonas sp. DA493 TaxID=3373605 RepID=UPI0037551961